LQAFEEVEHAEASPVLTVMMRLPNLLLVVVILLCAYIWMQLQKVSEKNRVD